jgi:small subunit ribosomal protein S6
MAFYESVFIARQDLSAAAAEALNDRFAGVIGENGGTVSKKEYWGLRNLAYKIMKNRKGHYMLLNIDGPAAAIDEMQRQMRINEDILRYLTVKVEALDPNPSAILQSRSTRDERPRRGERRFGGPEGDDLPVVRDDAPAVVPGAEIAGNGEGGAL